MLRCKRCREKLTEPYVVVDEAAYCEECANDLNYSECWVCHERHTHLHNIRFMRAVCDKCMEKLNSGSLFICDDCGEVDSPHAHQWVVVDGTRRRVCHSCRQYYGECHHCGKTFRQDRLKYRRRLCPECQEKGSWCHSCGAYTLKPNLTYYKGHHYCDGCIDDVDYDYCRANEFIESYHASHSYDWRPIYADDEQERGRSDFTGYGFELEVERTENGIFLVDAIEKIREMDGDDYFYIERDGSLNHGFEIISRPFTWAAWPDVFDKISEIMTYLRANGYESGTEWCNAGLHFHVSKEMLSVNAQAKLLVYAHRYRKVLLEISRRTESSFDRYARCLPLSEPRLEAGEKNKSRKRFQHVIDNYVNKPSGERHVAINLNNKRTVEFRFFKGTLISEYFDAAFTFVNFMVKQATCGCDDAPYRLYKQSPNTFKNAAKRYSRKLDRYISAAEKKELIAA